MLKEFKLLILKKETNMSISAIIVKVIGVALALFGLGLIFTSAGGLPSSWIAVLIGIVCLAGGIYIVRGGNFTP